MSVAFERTLSCFHDNELRDEARSRINIFSVPGSGSPRLESSRSETDQASNLLISTPAHALPIESAAEIMNMYAMTWLTSRPFSRGS